MMQGLGKPHKIGGNHITTMSQPGLSNSAVDSASSIAFEMAKIL